MRIDKIFINGYKNLKDFELDLEETSFNSIIIGGNGLGKSNVLEAIVIIFRNLDLGEKIFFDFKIKYEVKGQRVLIENSSKKLEFFLEIENEFSKLSKKEFYAKFLFPDVVFGYYSGLTKRFGDLFSKHEESFRDLLIKNKDKGPRRLFYTTPEHFQFVLLSFLFQKDKLSKEFLQKYLGVNSFSSFTLTFKEPHWRKGEGREKLWGAKGKVLDFFHRVSKVCEAPIYDSVKVSYGVKRTSTLETQSFFVDGLDNLEAIFSGASPSEVFVLLESAFLSDLILDIQVNLNVVNVSDPVPFSQLSEGQKQILTILGLIKFHAESETLFLLDEPDTQLNPRWAQDFLQILNDYTGKKDHSQLIIVSHNPILISGLERNEVVILSKDNGSITASLPDRSPKGMGVASILTSEIFGLKTALDKESYQLLREKRILDFKKVKSKKEKERLNELEEFLRPLELDYSSVDPLYSAYIKRLVEVDNKLLDYEKLSPKEKTQNMEILDEVLGIKN